MCPSGLVSLGPASPVQCRPPPIVTDHSSDSGRSSYKSRTKHTAGGNPPKGGQSAPFTAAGFTTEVQPRKDVTSSRGPVPLCQFPGSAPLRGEGTAFVRAVVLAAGQAVVQESGDSFECAKHGHALLAAPEKPATGNFENRRAPSVSLSSHIHGITTNATIWMYVITNPFLMPWSSEERSHEVVSCWSPQTHQTNSGTRAAGLRSRKTNPGKRPAGARVRKTNPSPRTDFVTGKSHIINRYHLNFQKPLVVATRKSISTLAEYRTRQLEAHYETAGRRRPIRPARRRGSRDSIPAPSAADVL